VDRGTGERRRKPRRIGGTPFEKWMAESKETLTRE